MKRVRVRLDAAATERLSGAAGVGMSREEWDARVDRAEDTVLRELFDGFEVARSFLGLRIVDVAARSKMSERMVHYLRGRQSGLTFRQAIALAEAHDMTFTLHVRMKRQKRQTPSPDFKSVKKPASTNAGESTGFSEELTDVR